MNNKLAEIKCPGSILKEDGRVYRCGAKLCMASAGSKIEIVCRRCKKKLLVVVNQDFNNNTTINIKQTDDN